MKYKTKINLLCVAFAIVFGGIALFLGWCKGCDEMAAKKDDPNATTQMVRSYKK